MKLTHRYGWKLLCGWLPPWDPIAARHGVGPGFVLIVDVGSRSQKIAAWERSGIRIRCGGDRVGVGRYLIRRQGDGFSTAVLQPATNPDPMMDRKPAPQVRQGEGALAVAAIGGADEVEQRLVFRDGEQLPAAEHPACWRKVAPKHTYLTDIGLRHGSLPPKSGVPSYWLALI